ncbi:hypothetical protein RB596_005381 [Gaeumannomyces avenae]
MSVTTSSSATMATPSESDDEEVSLESLSIAGPEYDIPGITKVAFDEQGDVSLLVGAPGANDQAIYTVCSRTLARASPLFDTLLRSSKADRQLNGGWTVKLPYDDPQSIRIILSIVHGRFRDVPDSMALGSLHQLCLSLDKYRIAECLGPWAKKWCQTARSLGPEDLTVEGHAQVAWVAYVLGNKSMLQEATQALLREASPSELSLKLEGVEGDKHLLPLYSAGILDNIKKQQIESLQSLVKLMHDTWSDCVANCSSGRGCFVSSDSERKICTAAVAGSLTASLHKRELLPSSKPIPLEEYTLADFVDITRNISGEIVQGCNRWGVDHRKCGPAEKVLKSIELAEKSFVPILAEAQVKRLKEQAERG